MRETAPFGLGRREPPVERGRYAAAVPQHRFINVIQTSTENLIPEIIALKIWLTDTSTCPCFLFALCEQQCLSREPIAAVKLQQPPAAYVHDRGRGHYGPGQDGGESRNQHRRECGRAYGSVLLPSGNWPMRKGHFIRAEVGVILVIALVGFGVYKGKITTGASGP
ncbi:hypothetical protein VFPPC_18459 [Pochonia chlamydosporia 170]|uniref:Uncharacterized protein n=1 Tax=Pochonia chlamydosporia 170 TaxID=1380566 RepID=A0A219AQ18_METCM|nr:hypothetical protein VFPPC_18459 [Pochonia chlamydosporia 170]OWT42404.1 hypothetical protein VFPPC_18459 [Pochonia chlamydosporia 170]